MAEVLHQSPAQSSLPVQPSAAPSGSPGDAWRVLGRDTPAGKALYRLYNGDYNGRGAGNTYHAHNKQVHEAKLAAGWSPPPKEPQAPVVMRPTVMYPKFGRERSEKEAPIKALRGRKPADQIQQELEAERQRQREYRPVPTGPLLDEKEKDRCAALMRYRGKVPAVTAEERAAAAVKRGKKSEREELQDMFDQVMCEIEERKAFLADMEKAGGLKRETLQQVRNEIKQRVDDLERINQMIDNAEDAARAAAGLPPSSARQ